MVPAEVYPLIAVVILATAGGTYMGLHKIYSDKDLRLKPEHEHGEHHHHHGALKLDQPNLFGQQAGGETYKDSQGWTRIKVKEEHEARK